MKYNIIALLIFLYGCGIQINEGIVDISTLPSPTPSSSAEASPTESSDQVDDDGSATGFGGGTHNATIYTNNVLTLNATTNNNELDESWTPKWSNLIAYYKLNESSYANGLTDSVIDSSDYNNHGTPYSSVNNVTGQFNSAANFDSTSDRIRIDSILDELDTTEGTISFWINATNLDTGYRKVLQFADDNNNQIGVSYRGADDSFRFEYIAGGNFNHIWKPEEYFADRGWTYITYTWSKTSGTTNFYLNGRGYGSGGTTGTFASHPTSARFGGANVESSMEGSIDDLAIWNQALSADEIALIYSRQSAAYAGTMESRIIETNDSNSSWTNLEWVTPLPFLKELTGSNGSESSSNYSELVGSTASTTDDDLMNGLVALWHFDETAENTVGGLDFKDSSATANDGYIQNTANVNVNEIGRFNKSIYIGGQTNNRVRFDGHANYYNPSGTVSFWFRTDGAWDVDGNSGGTSVRGSAVIFSLANLTGAGNGFIIGLTGSGHAYTQSFYISGVACQASGSVSLADSEWHHFAYIFRNGAGEDIELFIDGQAVATCTNSNSWSFDTPDIYLGDGGDHFEEFKGNIDEVAMWNRILNTAEILQLYRRGANRIKYQVRTCTAADCSDQNALTGDGWKGPGGNNQTYFSELHNNTSVSFTCGTAQACFTSEVSLDGNVNTTSPNINFSDFGNDGIILENNQYFQYRIILESDDKNTLCDSGTATCMPELKSVTIGPDHEI